MTPIEVVAAMIERNGRFLICQRPAHKSNPLGWEFPGGKVEKGETRAEALRRECREELSIDIVTGGTAAETVYDYPDFSIHLTLIRATLPQGEPQLNEHNALHWITKNEIRDYAFCAADRQLITQMFSE